MSDQNATTLRTYRSIINALVSASDVPEHVRHAFEMHRPVRDVRFNPEDARQVPGTQAAAAFREVHVPFMTLGGLEQAGRPRSMAVATHPCPVVGSECGGRLTPRGHLLDVAVSVLMRG